MTSEPTPAARRRSATAMAPVGAVDSLISVVLFVVANRLAGLVWAIVASTTWSVRASLVRYRRGLPIGKLLPITASYLLARGLAGILTDSSAVYFGIGIATQAGIGAALVASAVVGRSVLGTYAHRVLPFPEHVVGHRTYRSTMAHLTLLAGTYQLAKAGWDTWLFNNASLDGFVMLRFAAGWASAMVAIIVGLVYADLRLKRIDGFEGLVPMFEAMTPRGRPAPSS